MTRDVEHIFEDLKRQGLTDSERARLRNELSLYMSEHPLRAPLSVRMLDAIENWSMPSFAYTRVLSAALALVLVVGIGTSYAAENALPGDMLYPIKVNVNEAVVGSLALSQSSKAEWNATQVSRRLEEAEKLAAEKRLTPIARAQIEMQINTTAHNFDTNVAALQKSDDTAAIAAAQTDLQASLDAHEQVLASLSENTGAGTLLSPIISTVRAQALALATAQEHVNHTLASATPAKARTVALRQKNDASEAIGRVHAALKNAPTDTSADSVATIASSAISTGDQKMNEGDYPEAFAAFQTAARVAKTAEVHLDAATTLGFAASTSATSTATTTAATTTATTTSSSSVSTTSSD